MVKNSCCFFWLFFHSLIIQKKTKQNPGLMAMLKCLFLSCAIMSNLLEIRHYWTHSGFKLRGFPIDVDLEIGSLRPETHPQTQTWSTGSPQLVNQNWNLLRSWLYDSSRGPSCRANFLSAALGLHCLCLALLWLHLKAWWRGGGLV